MATTFYVKRHAGNVTEIHDTREAAERGAVTLSRREPGKAFFVQEVDDRGDRIVSLARDGKLHGPDGYLAPDSGWVQ